MSKFDELIENLERLETHLDAVYSGSLVVKDDLSSVLQILTHQGEGYDLINRAFIEQTVPPLYMTSHPQNQITRTRDNNAVILAIRAINNDDSNQKPIENVLAQEAVFHDNSIWPHTSSLTWKQVIAKSRNQHGSHVDDNPVQWLENLRIYPIANADVITFLLWSFGEALLEAITKHLNSNGHHVQVHKRRKALNGIEIQESHLVAVPPTSIFVGADIMLKSEHAGQRTIFGGVYNFIPFILGINPSRQIVFLWGKKDDNLEDLESHFLLGSAGDGLDRAARRKLRKKS